MESIKRRAERKTPKRNILIITDTFYERQRLGLGYKSHKIPSVYLDKSLSKPTESTGETIQRLWVSNFTDAANSSRIPKFRVCIVNLEGLYT